MASMFLILLPYFLTFSAMIGLEFILICIGLKNGSHCTIDKAFKINKAVKKYTALYKLI